MRDSGIVWDKTNIGENYPGITSPLTYSFIKNAYAKVYANFVKLVGVDREVIESNRVIFENMIGYVHGEVFYNIDNWYELVKLLPGYQYNKPFFENMLNPVAQKKENIRDKITFGFLWNNRKVIRKFFNSIIFITPLYKKFEKEFRETYQSYQLVNLKKLNNFEIVSKFEELQNKFFSTWAYTIVNDFRVMIYYGILTKFIKAHFSEESDRLLSLIYGIKNKPDSIRPLKRLIEMARFVKSSEDYLRLFEENLVSISEKMSEPKYKLIKKKITDYLDSFGERAFNELKLEETNFKEKPESLLCLLRHYIHYSQEELDQILSRIDVKQSKSINSFRNKLNLQDRVIFKYLVKNTVQSIYKREEYRLKRAKVFNIAKDFFKEISQRMVKAGDLKKEDDIFYLYMNEVFDHIRYHRLKEDLEVTIKKRESLLKDYEKRPLSRRVSTSGLPSQEIVIDMTKKHKQRLKGTLVSQGAVDNVEVVVMPKLNLNVNVRGKVLVTETTDPGWTVLFPLIKGVIIERGGLLSHASIVARELGIPCIIVQDATKILKTGDAIKLDVQGLITIV